MAFIIEKLAKLDGQTLTTLNWFSYMPDNGDGIAEVTTTGYFTNSPFINTEYGWANATIVAILDDGYYFLQVDNTEITAVQVSAGGGEIPAIEAAITVIEGDIELLEKNVRDYVEVDMENDDYTMTLDEANSAYIKVINPGDGTKVLTIPTTSDLTRPAVIFIDVSTLAVEKVFEIALESGVGVVDVIGGDVFAMMTRGFTSAQSVVFNGAQELFETMKRSGNGVETLDAGDTVLIDSMGGKLLIADDAVAQTLTINTGLLTENLKLEVYCTGVGGMTITAGTATVSGNTVLAATESCTIYRDALTDDYYCV